MIYMAEVLTAIDVLNLKYGAITRSDPLRLVASAHLLYMHCDEYPQPKKMHL